MVIQTKEYAIYRINKPVPLTGDIKGGWESADEIEISMFNWYKSGPQPSTTVRSVYDDSALYLQFNVEDHYTPRRQRNSMDQPIPIAA